MNRCPFWSTTKEKFDCYTECPMMVDHSMEGQVDEQCIFKECLLSSKINFRESIRDDYDFLNISVYDDEKNNNVNY